MSKYTWLIDAGHGGFVDGKYVTAPKKMFKFDDGFTVYEGVFNRFVANLLMEKLQKAGIDYIPITTDSTDVPLKERVSKANDLHSSLKNCVLVSVHGNAGGGTGFEVFTSVGETKSDELAEVFSKKYMELIPEFRFRKDIVDGDFDKEANFYILKQTNCNALLTENGFFDNRKDAEFMMSNEGQEKLADVHFQAIVDIENNENL